MAFDPALLPGWADSKDITTLLASGALTITTCVMWKDGTGLTFKFTYSDSSVGYIKIGRNYRVKIGGASPQFDTGTEILWQN